MDTNISFTLKVWRQNGPTAEGHFDTFEMKDIPGDTSFLEMLDILNEQLIEEGNEPFVFDHDCREGICGMCSLYINGHPHGPAQGATTCQLYMRRFHDGDVITVEPWRSAAFPIIKDCMVDRSAFDKIIAAGGYNSVRTGQAQDANAHCCHKAAQTLLVAQRRWLLRWKSLALVTVQTPVLVRPSVQRTKVSQTLHA